MTFFVTSHGKSACDGIGGVVKRATAKASIQRLFKDQIFSPQIMYEFCNKYLSKNINLMFVTTDEIKEKRKFPKVTLCYSYPILGAQRFHCFHPKSAEEIKVFELSSYSDGSDRKVISKRSTID